MTVALPRSATATVPLRRPRRLGVVVVCGLVVAGLAVELGWAPRSGWRSAAGVSPHARLHAPGLAAVARDGTVAPGARLQWLGHAGFLLSWGTTRILLDPNLSERCTVARRRWAADGVRRALRQAGPVDAVLVSHAHRDHLDLPTLRGLEGAPRVVVPSGAGRWVTGIAGEVEELPPLDASVARPATVVGDVSVWAVPAAHNGDRRHPLASRIEAVGYVLRRGGTTLYFAGDSGDGRHFDVVAGVFRPDVAVLPVGAFAPRWPLQRYHLSPRQAADVARRLGAGVVVPSHFGTFRLSLDRTSTALPRFAAAAEAADLPWAIVPVLSPDGAPSPEGPR